MSAPLSTQWDAEDWLAYFEERAAILEHDGGISRPFAEHWAWQACRVEAMWQISRSTKSIVGNPSPQQLIAITAARVYAADALLAEAFERRDAAE